MNNVEHNVYNCFALSYMFVCVDLRYCRVVLLLSTFDPER